MKSSATHRDHADGPASTATVARPLAPEEICPGDYVAILRVMYEVPSYFWCGDAALVDREEPVRLHLIPDEGGVPLKVKAVCLPYVLAKAPDGKRQSLDVRRHQLARLARSFAKTVWNSPGNAAARKRKRP